MSASEENQYTTFVVLYGNPTSFILNIFSKHVSFIALLSKYRKNIITIQNFGIQYLITDECVYVCMYVHMYNMHVMAKEENISITNTSVYNIHKI